MVPLGRYQHYKGGQYEVIANGLLESTEEAVVVYKSLSPNPKSEIWVRAEADFTATILQNGKQVPRFIKLD